MQGRLTIPTWAPRLLEAGRIAALLVLIVLLAWLVARVTWLIVSPGPAVSTLQPRPLPSPVRQATGNDIRADLSLVMTQNPFEASGSGPVEAVPDAPETDLNLKLSALFMSTGSSVSSATIVTPDNEARRYELGDEILPGVTLERVLSDRAIISREGREETLMRSGRNSGLSVIGDTPGTLSETGNVTRSAPPLFEPDISARTLVAGLNIEAQTENGRTTGLVLRPRGDASLMNAAGFEPGDQLVNVNGTRVGDVDPSALQSELSGGGITTVSVIRAGESRTFEIRFEEE